MKIVDVRNKIVEAIKVCSEEENISVLENTKLDDVLNSLEFVKVIVMLEVEFNIEIPDQYLIQSKLNSLSAMTQMILDITGEDICV